MSEFLYNAKLAAPFWVSMRAAERRIYSEALAVTGGSVKEAASALGVSHQAFLRRARFLGGVLPGEPKREPPYTSPTPTDPRHAKMLKRRAKIAARISATAEKLADPKVQEKLNKTEAVRGASGKSYAKNATPPPLSPEQIAAVVATYHQTVAEIERDEKANAK